MMKKNNEPKTIYEGMYWDDGKDERKATKSGWLLMHIDHIMPEDRIYKAYQSNHKFISKEEYNAFD